jgi:hypothetical protein
MEGLKESFPNDKVLKKHIIENMIYMSEINKKNCLITKMIFNKSKKYNINLFNGDTLTLDIKKVWNIDSFDIIIGNPPFNKPKDPITKKGYGAKSLWDLFVIKSLELLKPESGYLLFIHPPSWRKPEHYLWPILGKKQILYLKLFLKKDAIKIFQCAIPVDFYLLQNTKNHKKTEVIGQDNKTYKIDLSKWNFLPSAKFNKIYELLGKDENNNIKVIYSRSMYGSDSKVISKTKTKEFKYPIIHNMTKKNGLGFLYSNEKRGHFDIPKVILSLGEFQYPYNDWKGEYGMSNICFGIPIKSKEEGDTIIMAIKTPLFKDILKYTKWGTFQTDWKMFNYFKKDFYEIILKED